MDATGDELAGVVDLFGALTRDELERAIDEVAFRADGSSVDESEFVATLNGAVEAFELASDERPDEPLYVAGPTAFPTTPAHAEDLPHILEVDRRSPDRDAIAEQVATRYADAVTDAIDGADRDRAQWLLDVSYDVEAWGPVDLSAERSRLDEVLE